MKMTKITIDLREAMHDEDYNACNTFQQPDRLTPKSHAVSVSGSALRMELPPLAVATATVRLS